MKKLIVQIIIESEDSFILQKRDNLLTIVHGGKNSLWGGALEESDATPIDGALRELTEETSLCPKKNNLTPVCVTKYQGITHMGEKITHEFHVFHLNAEDNNFKVFEGEGTYMLPKDEDPADHNLTPSTNLIMSIYMQTLRAKVNE